MKKSIESIISQLETITAFGRANPTTYVARECLVQLESIKVFLGFSTQLFLKILNLQRQIRALPKGSWRQNLETFLREREISFAEIASGPDIGERKGIVL